MSKLEAVISNSISKFEEVLKRYDYIQGDLSQQDVDMIRENIEDHADCLDIWENDSEVSHEPMIEITVYGDGQNIALECMNCSTVIIDSEYFI